MLRAGALVCTACPRSGEALPAVPTRLLPQPYDPAEVQRLEAAIRRAEVEGRRADAMEFKLALQRLTGSHEPGRRPGLRVLLGGKIRAKLGG